MIYGPTRFKILYNKLSKADTPELTVQSYDDLSGWNSVETLIHSIFIARKEKKSSFQSHMLIFHSVIKDIVMRIMELKATVCTVIIQGLL